MATLEIALKRIDFIKKAEEHYNALRTNIQLSGDNLKVLAISSVKPGEGKSKIFPNELQDFLDLHIIRLKSRLIAW